MSDLEAEELATWAHVLTHPEDGLPALLLDDDELRRANEWLADNVGQGVYLQRSWIQPGPLTKQEGR